MGYYCTVPQCTSLAGKTKNVKFHRFPRDVTMADKWNTILKRGKPYTKYSKVCSLHFTQADYNVTTMGQWKTLSKDAVPSQNLPRLNPDGTVMVIRKSRTVKSRDLKKEESEQDMIWPVMAATPAHSALLDTAVTEPHDSHLAYRLQTLNTLANAVSPLQHNHSQGSNEALGPNGNRTLGQGSNQATSHTQPSTPAQIKPKKQDAIMQTDPIQAYRLQTLSTLANAVSPLQHNHSQGSNEALGPNGNRTLGQGSNQATSHSQPSTPAQIKPKKLDAIMQTDPIQDENETLNISYDSSEKSYGSEQVESFQQKDALEGSDYKDKLKLESPKDYTMSGEDYIPQTNDEYNKEAEKYALGRKALGGFEPPAQFRKPAGFALRYDADKYRDGYMTYQNQYPDAGLALPDPAETAFPGRPIKREDDDDLGYARYKENDETDPLSPLYERRTHPQRLLEQLQHQLKQEPDQNAHETVMQPQGSPYYQTNGHSNVPVSYYESPLSRPGPELLIAKQNALAAHTQLWQNTMKRPFFYSENPQLLHRYEEFSRILQ